MATNKDSNKQTPSAVKPTADKTFTSAKDSNIKERARAICCKLLLVLKKILGIDKGSNKQVPTVVPSTTDSSIISTIVTDKDLAQAVLDEYGYGALYSKDGKRLLKGPKGFSHYDIKEGTEIICNSAFYRCYNLTLISIPTSVTTIGSAAFRYCDKLSSITIPPSVHTMKGNPFGNCKSLTYITIQPSVTTIGFGAFYCCDNLDDATKLEIRKRFGDDMFKKTMCPRTCISKNHQRLCSNMKP